MTASQTLSILLVKVFTSKRFLNARGFLNKFLHLLLSLNIATPFEDWDQGKFSVEKYRERQRETNIEMAYTLCVNNFFSLIMLVPLFYTGREIFLQWFYLKIFFDSGYQIQTRHLFLQMLTGTLPEEDQSYENSKICIIVVTSLMVFTCAMEALTFSLYNNKV